MFGLVSKKKYQRILEAFNSLVIGGQAEYETKIEDIKAQVIAEIETSKDGNERASLKRILNRFN